MPGGAFGGGNHVERIDFQKEGLRLFQPWNLELVGRGMVRGYKLLYPVQQRTALHRRVQEISSQGSFSV